MGWQRWMELVLLTSVVGCGPTVTGTSPADTGDDGTTTEADTTGTSAMSTTATPTSATVGPDDSTGTSSSPDDTTEGPDSSDTDAPGLCSEGLACSVPVDCEVQRCGALGSHFDEDGCRRPSCSLKSTCPDDGVCFYPDQWGLCAPSVVDCEEIDSTCVCSNSDDCGATICMPAGEAPTALCGDFTDEGSCVDAGCSFIEGRPIVSAGDSCLCDLAEPRCVWMSPSTNATPGMATAYLNNLDQTVVVLDDGYDPPPAGYSRCDAIRFPPAECVCAMMLPCAM
ncbi:MAG: hypothetical protein AAF721_34145 [Myxococcota bacterium]